MKYIVMQDDEGGETIITFSKQIHHAAMAESLEDIRSRPIAAGFVENGKCHGRSETLDLDSRGYVDTALLNKG